MSLSLDFSSFAPRKTKNKRAEGGSTGRRNGQNYDGFKYQVSEKGSQFIMSNKLFDSLGLNSKSLAFSPMGEHVVVSIVAESHPDAVLYGTSRSADGKKDKKTRANVLETDMIACGLITEVTPDMIEPNKPAQQFFNLEAVQADNLPEGHEQAFIIVKTEKLTSTTSTPVAEATNEEVSETVAPDPQLSVEEDSVESVLEAEEEVEDELNFE